MKKKFCIFILASVLMIIPGCDFIFKSPDTVMAGLNALKKEDIIVYDVSINNFASFSRDRKEMKHFSIDKGNKFQNVFAYHSAELGEYYTIGDSVEGHFKILRVHHNEHELLYELEHENEAVFPIAQNEEFAFFATEKETSSGIMSNIIYLQKGDSLVYEDTPEMEKAILDGAICKQWLYFTVYKNDSTFELYKWNYHNPKSTPVLEKVTLTSPEIYCYKDKLYYYTDDAVHIGSISIPKDSTIYMKDDILLWFDTPAGREYACKIYDLRQGRLLQTMKGGQAFALLGEDIGLYSISGEEEVIKHDKR